MLLKQIIRYLKILKKFMSILLLKCNCLKIHEFVLWILKLENIYNISKDCIT